MAENKQRRFPMIPAKAWWALRERFKKTIPSKVDEGYLHTVLGVSEKSANANIIPALI